MSGSLFIDTNTAIYLLAGNEQVADLLNEQAVYVSVVTELELLSKPIITAEEDEQIKALLAQCTVIDLLPTLKETIIVFRRKYRLKLPDAIVASTAYALSMPLVTADKGFNRIEELTILAIEP